VVIEAQAAGLPVAVSDVGGPKELIQSPLQGRVLPARDVDAWVEGLVEMLARHPERSEREQMARAVHDERSWLRAAESFWADGLG
jgi:glycosyltransferase involved in cell wall biosynthesis